MNFKIIEGEYERIDYDSFKKDYMDMNIPKKDILRKYDLNHNIYLKYANRVYEDTGFKRRRGMSGLIRPMQNIRKVGNKYTVNKEVNRKRLYCGTYDSLTKALWVRDYLIEKNWSEDAIKSCMEL